MIKTIYIFFLKKPFLSSIIFLMISSTIISIINNMNIYDNHRYTNKFKKLIVDYKITKADLIFQEDLLQITKLSLQNKELISKYLNKSKIKDNDCLFFNFWVKRNENFNEKIVFFPAIWTNKNNYEDITSYIKITRDMITVNSTKRNERFTGLSFDEGIINVPISVLNSQNWHMITFIVTKKSIFRPREMFLFLDSNLLGNSFIKKNINSFQDLRYLNTVYKEHYPNNSTLMTKPLYSDYCFSQKEIKHLFKYDISRSFNDL